MVNISVDILILSQEFTFWAISWTLLPGNSPWIVMGDRQPLLGYLSQSNTFDNDFGSGGFIMSGLGHYGP